MSKRVRIYAIQKEDHLNALELFFTNVEIPN